MRAGLNFFVFLTVLGFVLLASTNLTLNYTQAGDIIFSMLFYFTVLLLTLVFVWLVSAAFYSTVWMRQKVYGVEPQSVQQYAGLSMEETVVIEKPEPKLITAKRIPEPILADEKFIRMIEGAIA